MPQPDPLFYAGNAFFSPSLAVSAFSLPLSFGPYPRAHYEELAFFCDLDDVRSFFPLMFVVPFPFTSDGRGYNKGGVNVGLHLSTQALFPVNGFLLPSVFCRNWVWCDCTPTRRPAHSPMRLSNLTLDFLFPFQLSDVAFETPGFPVDRSHLLFCGLSSILLPLLWHPKDRKTCPRCRSRMLHLTVTKDSSAAR